MDLNKEFYTVNDVAQLFGVTRTTVYSWMNTDRLDWIRAGARRRISRAAIEAFVQRGRDDRAPAVPQRSLYETIIGMDAALS